MSTGIVPNPADPLAPSELVLLRGERFASKALLGNVQLLLSEESVSVAKLGEAILAAAFLACHAAGSIRLETRQKKTMFGLRKVERLLATPADVSISWPAGCVETTIVELSRRYAGEDEHEVRNIVFRWLAQDHVNPWQATIDLIHAGLAGRGLLDRFDEKRLKVFVVTRYEVPSSTREMAMHQPVGLILEMLTEYQEKQADLWKLLVSELKAAIRSRTEDTDTDFD
jgi:hypothetical protein